MNSQKILLIDSDPKHAEALNETAIITGGERATIECAGTLASGLKRLGGPEVGAVFLNLFLPDSRGMDTLNRVVLATCAPIVVLGGADDEALCTEAMSRGAHDYLLEGRLDSCSFARAARNVLERERTQRKLLLERERAQVTLNSIGDGVLSTDIWGRATYLNAVAEEMTGWTSREAAGRALAEVFEIVDGTSHNACPNPVEAAMRQDHTVRVTPNCQLVRRDGQLLEIENCTAPIHDRNGRVTGTVLVFHDVSIARKLVLKMSHLAQHDPLTDLPNRVLFRDRLTQAISWAHRNRGLLAVLFLDLDGFKQMNDSLGHIIGDKVLLSVAGRISGCLRKSDTVSRQGGDEFVVLLPEVTHAADAAISAAKIINELRRPHHLGEHRLNITASVGLSTYPYDGEDAETLIKNADTAMYHAKQCGRDNYQFFHKKMNLRNAERHSLEGQLRYALERNEFLLHYQPKVNLSTGTVTSAEALVRWQHPERGLLLPAQFLAIAEESGLMLPLGRWVMHEVCRQMRAWMDAGLPAVPVAVNISSEEFRGERFVESIGLALKSERLDAHYLELELTETVLMWHAESSERTLEKLKAAGVRLAVDDFGTGYSSLGHLMRFAIDAFKLDQSFVRNIVSSSDDAPVVSAVIGMGKSLRHRVIAKGVETPEQFAFLRAQGCDEGQGYYFNRPMLPAQFEKLLANDTCQSQFSADARSSAGA